jgi:hypothetical protein
MVMVKLLKKSLPSLDPKEDLIRLFDFDIKKTTIKFDIYIKFKYNIFDLYIKKGKG